MAIQETLYTLGDGNNYTQQEALEYFGDAEFDDLINSGQLYEVEVEEEEETPTRSLWELEGEFYEEADAINYFGQEVFNELVQTNQLKKKDTSENLSSFSDIYSQSEEITPSQSLPPITEQDFFEGGFGDALRGFDAIVPLGIGDFIDDMTRAVAGGINQGIAGENASDLLFAGSMATEEDIASYIEANKNAQKYGSSQEMQEYQKTYEEYGGILGVVMGLAKSGLTILPEIMLSSFFAMAANSDALAAGGTIVAGSATAGALTAGAGASVAVPIVGTVVGAAAGAITGAAASLPYAFAAASTALEMGATFSELLQGEIDGELTPEKIKAALSNEKTYTSIRNKAVARGITIGALDMISGKVGGRIASSVLKKGARATGVSSRATKIKALAASSAVEGVGGSIGETAGIAATNIVGDTKGQDFDISEIVLEGIAEIPGGVKDMVSARFSKPKYKVNGERVDAATIDSMIETMTLEQLTESRIQIDNDYEGRDAALQDRKVTLSIENQVRKVIPNITPEAVTEIVTLQKELQSLEGNKTEVGKKRTSEIKGLINEIITNQTAEAGVVEVTDEAVVARIKEIKGDDSAYTQEEFDNIKKILEAENEAQLIEAQEEQVITSTEEFRGLEQSEQIDYLEKATKELAAEAEADGKVDFEITESQALTRANQLFQDNKNEISRQERLDSRAEKEKKQFGEQHADEKLPYEKGADGKGRAKLYDITKPNEKGVVTAEYVNPETGVVDVIISGQNDDNFVGYVRVYENGKPTNMFTAKMESTGDAFKDMITDAEAKLPDNAEVVETTSISIDGLKSSSKSKRTEKVDADGNIVTRPTPYSAATKESVASAKGTDINPFENFKTTDKAAAEAEVAKIEAAYPGITATINERKGPPTPPPRPGTKDKASAKAKPEYTVSVNLPVLVSPKSNNKTKVETKKFRDDQVVLKEETFTVTDEEGGRVVTTVRTNLDGSLRKAETESFDADGNSLGKGRDISLADNNKVVEKGLTAEQILTDRLVEGEVIEKTERSGTEINNPKRIAGLTTDQKQKLGIETKTETDAVQESKSKSRKQKSKVEQQVDNARKALKTIDNEIEVVYHTDDASYRDATNEQSREQSTNGEYNPATKTIHINGTKANNKTVAHEVFHALLLRTGITNEQAKAITDRMIKAVKKTASPELIEKLEKFSSNYESSLQSEESIAELFGLLASEYPKLDAPTQSIVKRWLDKIAKLLGVKPFTDAEVIDLLNVVSAKVEAGQEITAKDVKILGKNKSKKEISKSRKQTASKASSVEMFENPDILQPKRMANGRTKVIELGRAFDKRAKDNGTYIPLPKDGVYTDAQLNKIAEAMTDDAQLQLLQDDSGIGWYDLKTKSAMELMSRIHPELSDSNSKPHLEFTLMVALISQNNSVGINFRQANEAYTYYKNNNNLPNRKYAGKSGNIIKQNIALAFEAIEKKGWENYKNTLQETKTVKEWEAEGYKVNGENKTTKITGAMAMLGSKIGSFWGNLNGDFDTLTADLWFSRMFNRYTGNVVAKDKTKGSKKSTLSAIDSYKGSELLYGFNKAQLLKGGKTFDKWLNTIAKNYADGGYKSKIELNIVANTHFKNLAGSLQDLPRGGKERNAMRDVVKRVQGKLIERGYPKLDIADIQAIVWYNEKDLYRLYKAVNKSSEKTDYETAAQEVLREQGVNAEVALPFQRSKSSTDGGRNQTDTVQSKGVSSKVESPQSRKQEDSSKEVSEIESEIEYLESEIENKQEEIAAEKSDTKDAIQKKKDEIAKVKKSKKSPAKKRDLIEELKEEIEQLKEDGLGNIEYYIEEVKEAKRELKKQEKKLAKLKAKPAPKPKPAPKSKPAPNSKKSNKTYRASWSGSLDTSIEVSEDYNQMTDQWRKKNKQINLASLEEVITTEEANKLKLELRDNLEKAKVKFEEAKSKPAPKPKAKKILEAIPETGDVTAENKITIADNLRAITKGVKTAVVSWMRTSKFLAQEIGSMVKSGRITVKQSAAILKKFSGVNMFNEASIDRFVDFMARVINNAEYAEQLSTARKNIKRAKKNIRTKIGSADAVAPMLSQIFDVNPSLIPESVWKIYTDLVADFSGSGAVISPSNVESVSLIAGDIIDSLNAEFSQTEELGNRYDAFDKVLDKKTGAVDYAATIKKMEKEGVITPDELSIMSKYKTDIAPPTPKTPKTKAEIQAEKDAIIKDIKGSPTLKISSINNKLDRAVADRFVSLMSTPEVLESMSLKDLQQIQKLMDNINNGYLPHLAQVQVEKMSSVLNSNILTSAIQGSKLLPASAIYGRLKSLVTKRGAISEMIRRNPLFYIDQIFGDFKTKDIFNSVFNQSAIAQERYEADIKKIFGRIDKAQNSVAKTYRRNPNGLMKSKFKQMIYSIQLEAESNLGNPEVNQAGAYIKKTIEAIMDGKTTFTKRDADMLNEIYNEFEVNGEIDINKLYDSFSKVEKASIKEIQDINIELQEKAVFTSAVIRGDRMNPRNNYTHLNVITAAGKDNLAAPSEAQKILQSLRPSTKANSLIERTGNVAPLNFDYYASASRGAKGVLLDFYMTEPIRTTHRTLDRTKESLKDGSNMMPGNQREKFNAIRDSFDEVIGNLYVNAFTQNGLGDAALKFMNRNGYRAILASSTRWIAELTSNTAFALITNPRAFTIGAKIGLGFLNSDAAPKAMKVLGSKQTTRIYPSDSLSGRMVDTNLMNQAQGEKGGRVKGRFKNKMTQIWNLTGAKYAGSVATVSDALISTPDKIVMRPMWFGSFSAEFEKITGQKPDFDKIASEDSAYMSENAAALKDATTKADETSVMTGSTANPFMGILKGQSKPEDGLMTKAFNNFNTFMTTFLIYEYVTARTGIVNAVGGGVLGKAKGAQLLAGSATRMITYTMLATVLSEALTGLAGDEPEEQKAPEKQLGQAIASTVSSMMLGRDFGNATKAVINYGIEEFNKEFLDFLRDGEYDSFKDGIQYQVVPQNKDGRGSDIGDFIKAMSAGYSPFIKTVDFMIGKATESPKVTEAARKRQQDEVMIRLPLEVLGNTGLIPLYKDVRKMVLRNLYGEMRKASNESAKRKAKELDKLQGYDSRSDMKRYDYRLWMDTFGPNSMDWNDEQRIKEEKRRLREAKQRIKDEENGYTGRGTKSGFGNSGFGSGGSKRKTKKKGGFGSSGFGTN